MTAAVDYEFLINAFDGLTTERKLRLISEWAAEKRYLPRSLTNHPGKWDNSFAPYLTEIMDCLSPINPARKVAVMKGVQVGATTGPLENFLGFSIDEDPCGIYYVSADKDLTKMAIEIKVDYPVILKNRFKKPFDVNGT